MDSFIDDIDVKNKQYEIEINDNIKKSIIWFITFFNENCPSKIEINDVVCNTVEKNFEKYLNNICNDYKTVKLFKNQSYKWFKDKFCEELLPSIKMDNLLKKNGDFWGFIFDCSKNILWRNRTNKNQYELYIYLSNLNIKKWEMFAELNKKIHNISMIINENNDIKLLYTTLWNIIKMPIKDINEWFINENYKLLIVTLYKIFVNKQSLNKFEDIIGNLYYYLVETFIDNKDKIGNKIFLEIFPLISDKYNGYREKMDSYIRAIFTNYKTEKCLYVFYKKKNLDFISTINSFLIKQKLHITDELFFLFDENNEKHDCDQLINYILEIFETYVDDIEKSFVVVDEDKQNHSQQKTFNLSKFINSDKANIINNVIDLLPSDAEKLVMFMLWLTDVIFCDANTLKIFKVITSYLFKNKLTKKFLKQFSIFDYLDITSIKTELKWEISQKRNIYKLIVESDEYKKIISYAYDDNCKNVFNFDDFRNSDLNIIKYVSTNVDFKLILELIMKFMFGNENEINLFGNGNIDISKLWKDDIENFYNKIKSFTL